MVYRLKYNNRPDIGEDMGRIMAREMQLSDFFSDIDVLLPVPLSRKRLRQRGYNQSEMLAIGISDITHLPIVTKALRRKEFHQSQTKLNRWERQENVADTFQLTDDSQLKGRHVLLIDDICTTGATLIACADALKGVEGIRISLSFRRALLYPFNYQGNKKCCKGSHFLRKMTTFAVEFHKIN